MSSMRTQIAQKIISVVNASLLFKYASYQVIKMLATDFSEYELPALQFIDLGDDNQHDRSRAKKTWNVTLEIVIGPIGSANYVPTQDDLWDLIEHTEQALFADPKLDIPEVIHMRLLGSSTDLHILKPLYTARIDLQIDYYQALVRPC